LLLEKIHKVFIESKHVNPKEMGDFECTVLRGLDFNLNLKMSFESYGRILKAKLSWSPA